MSFNFKPFINDFFALTLLKNRFSNDYFIYFINLITFILKGIRIGRLLERIEKESSHTQVRHTQRANRAVVRERVDKRVRGARLHQVRVQRELAPRVRRRARRVRRVQLERLQRQSVPCRHANVRDKRTFHCSTAFRMHYLRATRTHCSSKHLKSFYNVIKKEKKRQDKI